jgi:glycerol-3-phosphate acyltransferase PlsY
MPWILLGIIISYLIGSIPTAYLFGRLLKGIDIRKFGSGNVGATNALRVLGKGPGLAVLCLDIFKGFIPVVFLGNVLASRVPAIPLEVLRILLGVGCIAGHNWTLFLKFKGGKGIATTLGVLIGLATQTDSLRVILALVILTWLLTFIIWRFVSLASLAAGVSLPVYMCLFRQSAVLLVTSIILSVFVILRHKANLVRLFKGTEPQLRFKN